MYEYTAKIVKIVDGDTIDVDIDLGFDVWLKNQRIRLNGVDAPESRTSDEVEKVFGLLTKDKIKSLLSINETCVLKTFKDERGKFGRILGDFIINDKLLSEILIEEKLAVPYFGQNKDEIQEKHLENREYLISENIVDSSKH